MALGVAGVVGQGLGADVVDRLDEARAARRRDRPAPALAAVAMDHVQRVALALVDRGVARRRDRAALPQRDRDILAADLQRDALAPVGEPGVEVELEGHVLDGIAIVVDVDLVDRVVVEDEVVRTTVGMLEREIVRDQRHVLLAGPARSCGTCRSPCCRSGACPRCRAPRGGSSSTPPRPSTPSPQQATPRADISISVALIHLLSCPRPHGASGKAPPRLAGRALPVGTAGARGYEMRGTRVSP